MRITLTINGKKKLLDIPANRTLIDLLRAQNFWSVKHGCETGECGSCAVIVNGMVVNSCMMLAAQVDGKSIETLERLGTAEDIQSLREAFEDFGTVECGHCVPGMIISVKALLDKNSEPTEGELREALAGNLCHCTGNAKPIQSLVKSVKKMLNK
ncbi:MAG: (2Fe-2S)-binding protein [bacterium]